jgi:hypothetical protein
MIFGMVPQNPLKIPFVYKLFTFALLRQLIHRALSGMWMEIIKNRQRRLTGLPGIWGRAAGAAWWDMLDSPFLSLNILRALGGLNRHKRVIFPQVNIAEYIDNSIHCAYNINCFWVIF